MDSIHNRLTAIDVEAGGAVHSAASYVYMGSARRVALTLGGIIALSFGGANGAPASSGGYPGLDHQGRPIDLHYTDIGGAIALPDGSAGTAGETVSDIGATGWADVVGVRVYGSSPGVGDVTGIFVTRGAEVMELFVVGLAEPIVTTPAHRFWSEDREGWVTAGTLVLVRNCGLTARARLLLTWLRLRDTETVYNLEVFGNRTHFVSNVDVLVHNNYQDLRDYVYKWVTQQPGLKQKHKFQMYERL